MKSLLKKPEAKDKSARRAQPASPAGTTRAPRENSASAGGEKITLIDGFRFRHMQYSPGAVVESTPSFRQTLDALGVRYEKKR